MIVYRDRSYCADMDYCKTKDCSKRMNEFDELQAKQFGLPISWMPYRDLCGRFEEIKK